MFKKILHAVMASGDKRDRARYSIVNRLAQSWGFRLYQKNSRWFESDEFREAWKNFPDPDNNIHDRRYNLYNLAKAFRDIPGDIAECGVYRGRGMHLLLKANEGTKKHAFGFDSFEGLSEPTGEDLTASADLQWSKNTFASEETRAAHNLAYHAGRFTLFKGWIPDKFDFVKDKTFSIVHIDVDLYQPTRDALEFFYPRLNPMGILICDDYGSVACPGAKKAVDDFCEGLGKVPAALTTGQAIIF